MKVELNKTYVMRSGRIIQITEKQGNLYTSPDSGHKFYEDGMSTAIGSGSDLIRCETK
mgnify:CR=1 FL=1